MTSTQAAPGWYADPSGAIGWRYFDGTDWTNTLPSETERIELLDIAVADAVRKGWRVESRSPTQAVLVRGWPASGGVHVIHFLLTLLTFGLWVFVWILYAMSRGEYRETLTVDAYGDLIIG